MKKEISFKSLLANFKDWLNNNKNTDTQGHDTTQHDVNRADSGFDHPSAIHPSPSQAQTKYDRYYPLYLQDRDVNSHF